jgi:hypothetical protein
MQRSGREDAAGSLIATSARRWHRSGVNGIAFRRGRRGICRLLQRVARALCPAAARRAKLLILCGKLTTPTLTDGRGIAPWKASTRAISYVFPRPISRGLHHQKWINRGSSPARFGYCKLLIIRYIEDGRGLQRVRTSRWKSCLRWFGDWRTAPACRWILKNGE